jgi:alpha-D-xyloside xylohydrolase
MRNLPHPHKTLSPVALAFASLLLGATSGLPAPQHAIPITGYFYESAAGRVSVSGMPCAERTLPAGGREADYRMADGRLVTVGWSAPLETRPASLSVTLHAEPADDIRGWGLTLAASPEEYFTGLMERVVDKPSNQSPAACLAAALNLRGQRIEMLVKSTTALYAPFFLSSRGYGVLARTDWPGHYDFCASDPAGVTISFDGPSLALTVYHAATPAAIVQAHALDVGPVFVPPRWTFTPWRWRNEHRQRRSYYDGTPVTGPFNAEVMEDVLMMKAYGVPCGVYWIDRPWGRGGRGYDDFEIDERRLPNFAQMVHWLDQQDTRLLMWIGPFYQGRMAREALERGFHLPGQDEPSQGNRTYPLVDMTHPGATAYWQEGVAKLLKLGVAGFKLDRGDEHLPDDGPLKVFDGRSVRQVRNTYATSYLKAAYDVTQRHRGEDFVLMPRAAYTGSSRYGVFWGGDVAGTNEGLRESIIAVQRAAIMGYPIWGSDTGGYGRHATMEQDLLVRWLGFSCFTPIMEVGPTRDVGLWNLPRTPSYDDTAIAAWRLYGRLHERLADYGHALAKQAAQTGQPIVRPLMLVDPQAPEAWKNWWTYLYGPDLLVSPIWRKGQRSQEVYLPTGDKWRDAWNPDKVYAGGQTLTVNADLHQIPLFVREGANVSLGDLHAEWHESLAIAQQRPDLKMLDAAVRTWFDDRPSQTLIVQTE